MIFILLSIFDLHSLNIIFQFIDHSIFLLDDCFFSGDFIMNLTKFVI